MKVLNKFADSCKISRTSVYAWVHRFEDELIRNKIILKDRIGGRQVTYVLDDDKLFAFMESKGVKLR